jgi:prepilin-type N-terminal cleavage/methylation domain-containing protein
MKKNNYKGFTLIELLVVISIIGLLSSVVLVSLSNARAKGRDTARVQTLGQIRNALELYYAKNNSYPIGSGETIEAIVQDDLNEFISVVPNNLSNENDSNYIGSQSNYQLMILTETGGSFARNNGCDEDTYESYNSSNSGMMYCLGNYGSTSGGGGGDNNNNNNDNLALSLYKVTQGNSFGPGWTLSGFSQIDGLSCSVISALSDEGDPVLTGQTGSLYNTEIGSLLIDSSLWIYEDGPLSGQFLLDNGKSVTFNIECTNSGQTVAGSVEIFDGN